MKTFEYKPLSPWDVRGVQRLAQQDLELARVPDASDIANPNSVSHLVKGFMAMKAYQGEYIGASSKNHLEGYLKIGEWGEADDREYSPLKLNEPIGQLEMGIFGLVVSSQLEKMYQVDIACNLLDMATDRGRELGASAINIVFHQHDPIRRLAVNHGYEFTGRTGEVGKVPGIVQSLYSMQLVDTAS